MEKFQKLKSTRNTTIAKCLYNSRLWRWIVQRQPREFKAPESTAALPCKSFTPECGQTVVWFDFKPMMVLESPPMALEPRACWFTRYYSPHTPSNAMAKKSLFVADCIADFRISFISRVCMKYEPNDSVVALLCSPALTDCLPACHAIFSPSANYIWLCVRK